MKKNKYRKLFTLLRTRSATEADAITTIAHNEVFSKTNCLDCAACCKGYNPIVEEHDIVRISEHLKITPVEFLGNYTFVDEDDDWVIDGGPCPFLEEDNKCSIYEFRPESCQDYPHTGRKNLSSLEDLTIENAAICPAVENIMIIIDTQLKAKS